MVKIMGTEFEKDEILNRLAYRVFEYSAELLKHQRNMQLNIYMGRVAIAGLTSEARIRLYIERWDERAYIKYNMRFNSEE